MSIYNKLSKKYIVDKLLDISLLLYIISIYCFENPKGANIWNILMACFVVVYVLDIGFKKKLEINIYHIWIWLVIILSLIVSLYAKETQVSFGITYTFMIITIISFLLYQYLYNNKNHIIKLFKYIVIGGVCKVLMLIPDILDMIQIINSQEISWVPRLGSISGENPNIVAMNMGIAFAASIMMFKINNDKNRFKNILYIISSVLIGIIILFTGSRKIMALIIGIFILNNIIGKNKYKIMKIIMIFMLISISYKLVMNVPIFYETLGKRIDKSVAYKDAGVSDSFRKQLIDEGVSLFINRPWGYGLDNSRFFTSSGFYTHNNYLELLISLGFIGAIIYYGIYIYIIVNLYRIHKMSDIIATNLLLLILGIMIIEYAQVTYTYKIIHLILLTSVSYIQLIRKSVGEE